MFWGGSSAPARFLVPILPCLAPIIALAFKPAQSAAARGARRHLAGDQPRRRALVGVVPRRRLMLFSDPHAGARACSNCSRPARRWRWSFRPLPSPRGAPNWVRSSRGWSLRLSPSRRCSPYRGCGSASAWQLAGVASLVFLLGGAIVSATPSAGIREVTARRNDLDVLNRYDGTRFRTLDYQALGRATPDRLRDLLTLVFEQHAPDSSESSSPPGPLQAGPVTVPPGRL